MEGGADGSGGEGRFEFVGTPPPFDFAQGQDERQSLSFPMLRQIS
jgi:hypothetical protein